MRHGAVNISAAMAFYALTSLAPLLVIAVTMAGLFMGEEPVRVQVVEQIQAFIGPSTAALVDELIRTDWFDQPGVLPGGLSFVVFLFASTVAMEHLRDSLNKVWEVPAAKGSKLISMIRGRLISFSLVVATGFVLLASLVARAVAVAMGGLLEGWLPFDSTLFQAGGILASLLGLTTMFALLFRFLPEPDTPWSDVLVGAAVTAVLFQVGVVLIGFYLGWVGVASPYGAVGSIVILLFWIYYSSLVFLWGAEFACVYSRKSPALPGPEGT